MAHQARIDVVERLILAATDGMLVEAEGTTAGEVLSAYMTMALRAIHYARDHGGDLSQLRTIVMRIYMELPEAEIN